MISTYELPDREEYADLWDRLELIARAGGWTLRDVVRFHVEREGTRLLEIIPVEYGKRWQARVEHEGPLSFAGVRLQLTGE